MYIVTVHKADKVDQGVRQNSPDSTLTRLGKVKFMYQDEQSFLHLELRPTAFPSQ